MNLRLLGIAAFVVAAVIFLRTDKPLADAASLKKLIAGEILLQPPAEPIAHFHGRDVVAPGSAELAATRSVLGYTSAQKRIEVDLTNQRVYAYEGERKIYEFVVSTGKWAPTPTGEFRIWAKVRSQKMSGGDKTLGTYYYLPNVPYVMFFYNAQIAKMRGFSFHGTYWHDNFGHPMSHGCVNMRIADAQTLYEWASPVVTNEKGWSTLADSSNVGTRVLIYGQTPRE